MGDRDALDWMWYLWIGLNSPASGRLVRTFERADTADKTTWVEPMDPYYTLTKSLSVCDDIMREFCECQALLAAGPHDQRPHAR